MQLKSEAIETCSSFDQRTENPVHKKLTVQLDQFPLNVNVHLLYPELKVARNKLASVPFQKVYNCRAHFNIASEPATCVFTLKMCTSDVYSARSFLSAQFNELLRPSSNDRSKDSPVSTWE